MSGELNPSEIRYAANAVSDVLKVSMRGLTISSPLSFHLLNHYLSQKSLYHTIGLLVKADF
jgi:hypothetical protein